MSDLGRGHHHHPRPVAGSGAPVARRGLLALLALVAMLVGAAATAPSADARPRDRAPRAETARDRAPRAVAPQRAIDRAAAPRVAASDRAASRVETPVAIRIPAIGVAAPVEILTTVDNKMQDPTGPEVVAWYDDTDGLGRTGNAVFAGHLDYAGVGPAVFAELNQLAKNDRILVTDDNGDVHAYRVVSRQIVDATTGPWEEVTASTRRPTLTLITCAGPWDDAIGHYRDRLVVRAVRVGS